MALDATPKGTTANSYGTVEEADAYFSERRVGGEAWADLTTAAKERALIMATTLLERGFTWEGSIREWNQKLSLPRSGIYTDDGRTYDYDTVPDGVKEAQFELAWALTKKDRLAAQEPELLGNGFSRVKAGEVEVEVDSDAVLPIIPPHVVSLLEPFGTPKSNVLGSGMKMVKLER